MKFLKNNFKLIIGLILGAILAGGIVYASTAANQVTYKTNKNDNVKNVSEALNDLYSKFATIKNHETWIESEKICENGQISKQSGSYETANYSKIIEPNCIIIYKVKVNNDWYGPYAFNYTNNGQSVGLNAHTSLNCKIYNDKIEAIGYQGEWKDIYIDMIKVSESIQ